MSILITDVRNNSISMTADTRETAFETGGVRVMDSGKILRTETQDGKQLLVGVVGNSNHIGLLTYILHKQQIAGDSYDDLFTFFATFYDEADHRGASMFHADGSSFSEFHVAFADKAFLVRGLTLEPIRASATSGSGADLAFGAICAGATTLEAVQIACEYNAYCSFPVDTWVAQANGTFLCTRLDRDGNAITKVSHTPPPMIVETD